MGFNKKVLSKAVSELDKAKAPGKPKDIIVDPAGQWKYPGQKTRIPSSDITMQGVNYPVFAQPNVGPGTIMYPNQDYKFPGADYVDETPLVKKGGTLKSKKYSKSMSATNKLFAKNKLFQNKKSKIFDPNAKFKSGGSKLGPINLNPNPLSHYELNYGFNLPVKQDGGESDYEELELTPEEIQAYKDGGYVVEEIPEQEIGGYVQHEIAKAQTGLEQSDSDVYTYAGRPDSYYKKDDKGQWFISNKGTGNKFIPIKDPKGTRAKVLNEQAKKNVPMANSPYALAASNFANNKGTDSKQAYIDKYQNSPELAKQKVVRQFKTDEELAKTAEFINRGKLENPTNTDQPIDPRLTGPASDNTRTAAGFNGQQAFENALRNASPEGVARRKMQADWEKQKWDEYAKKSLSYKILDRTQAFIAHPLLMTGNVLSGNQGYIPGMGRGLLNKDNPEEYDRYLQATGQQKGAFEVNDLFNMINPTYWGASTGNEFSKGNYGQGTMELGLLLLGAGAGKGLLQGSKALTQSLGRGAKYVGKAMNTAPRFLPGATLNNAINAGFAGHGLYNIASGDVAEPWKKAMKTGKGIDYANALGENIMTALEVAPLVGPAAKGLTEGLNTIKELRSSPNKAVTLEFNPQRSNELNSISYDIRYNNQKVGEVSGNYKSSGDFEISDVGIDKAFQKKGISKQAYSLLNEALPNNKVVSFGAYNTDAAGMQPGKNLWESLVREGKAKKVGNSYEMLNSKNVSSGLPGSPNALQTPVGFQNRVFDSNVQLGSFKGKGHLSEKGYNYRTLGNEEIKAIQESKGVFPKLGKAKGGNENVKYWTKGNEKNWYAENPNQQVIRVKDNKFSTDKIADANDVEIYNHETGAFESIIPKHDSFKSEANWSSFSPEILEDKELLQEYLAIEKEAKANKTWMKYSDGTKFKGTPEQFIQMRSKNLQDAAGGLEEAENWYKQSLYRGQKKATDDFLEGNRVNGITWLSPDKAMAESYARTSGLGNKNNVKTIFNPHTDDPTAPALYQLGLPKVKTAYNIDAKGKLWSRLRDPEIEKFYHGDPEDPFSFTTTDHVARYIKDKNIDIANIENVSDYGSQATISELKNKVRSLNPEKDLGQTVIVNQRKGFYPKSLMYNNGKFDLTNPNIYKVAVPGIVGGAALMNNPWKNEPVTFADGGITDAWEDELDDEEIALLRKAGYIIEEVD